MKLFKLYFLYFLSFTGFLCYGDSFSNGVVVAQWGAVNPTHYPNGKSMYYVVSAQQWDALPDEIKTDVFQVTPEQIRAFFDYHGLDERDMVAHYIGSMGHVEADVISGKVKMFDEIYTSMGMGNHTFREGDNNGGVIRTFIAGSSMEDTIQTQRRGQQDWGMNIRVMDDKEEPKMRMIGALPLKRGVVDSISTQGIMAKAIGFENIGVDISYMANAAMQGMAGKMVFMKNNTDYVMAKMEEKGLGIDMTAPYQNLQFYLAEPIGGGGGAAILASMGVDVHSYLSFAERQVFEQAQHWEQLLEREQTQEHDIPDVWVAFPDNQALNNPAFLEMWSQFFNK